MERYIGLDVHAASCTLAVISQTGRRLRDFPVETNGQALVPGAFDRSDGAADVEKRLCLGPPGVVPTFTTWRARAPMNRDTSRSPANGL